MFRLWKVAYFAAGFAPLMDAPDAGSGGGEGDPDDGGAGDPPADDADGDAAGADADGDHARGSSDDDDEDDDDEDLRADVELTPERFKRVAAKLRKLSRRDRRFSPTRARLKELQDAGLSLDDLVTTHRNFRALDDQIRRNPKLRALVHGDADEDANSGGRRSRQTSTEDEFDESTLPFDANESPTNRYFANMAKANHDLRKQVTQLATRLDRTDGRDSQRTEREESREWKTVLDGALGRIKQQSLKTTLSDAVVAAFQRRTAHGKSATQVVNHYITQLEKDGLLTAKEAKDAKAGNTGQPTGRAATQQRIAENNRNLPRTVAPTGTAAPARTGRERLADVNKRVRNLSSIAR